MELFPTFNKWCLHFPAACIFFFSVGILFGMSVAALFTITVMPTCVDEVQPILSVRITNEVFVRDVKP